MSRQVPRQFARFATRPTTLRSVGRAVLFGGILALLPFAARGGDAPAQDARSSMPNACTPSDCGLRDGDSLWLVRSRDIFTCDSHEVPASALGVQQYRDQQWHASDMDQLRTTAEQAMTVVYVHGNRADESSAITRGSVVYRLLADSPGAPALNLIVWSWPSDKIRGPMRDFRTKAARTDDEAWYLARMLEQLGPRSQVNLTGYSYGARIITGATNLVGGGDLYGRRLADAEGNAAPSLDAIPRYRVVLLAAALHNDWLIEGHFHGQSLDVVERMVVLFNPCDPALKRYDRVFPEGRPLALGAYGVADSALGANAERVEQWNVSAIIGRTHDEWAYLNAPWVAERLRAGLLPPTSAPPSQSNASSTQPIAPSTGN